jgi:hypothetical protein
MQRFQICILQLTAWSCCHLPQSVRANVYTYCILPVSAWGFVVGKMTQDKAFSTDLGCPLLVIFHE